MRILEIDTRSAVPIYAQIMDQIRALVRERELVPGDPLPSVRQLAGDLEINPNTVARSYGLLAREGILETARRRGTLIADSARDRERRSPKMPDPLVLNDRLECGMVMAGHDAAGITSLARLELRFVIQRAQVLFLGGNQFRRINL